MSLPIIESEGAASAKSGPQDVTDSNAKDCTRFAEYQADKERRQKFGTLVSNRPLYDNEISDQAFRLLTVLRDFLGQKDVCWPSYERLGFLLDWSHDKIGRYMKELTNAGYVDQQRFPNPNGNGGWYYKYRLYDIRNSAYYAVTESQLSETEVRNSAEAEYASLAEQGSTQLSQHINPPISFQKEISPSGVLETFFGGEITDGSDSPQTEVSGNCKADTGGTFKGDRQIVSIPVQTEGCDDRHNAPEVSEAAKRQTEARIELMRLSGEAWENFKSKFHNGRPIHYQTAPAAERIYRNLWMDEPHPKVFEAKILADLEADEYAASKSVFRWVAMWASEKNEPVNREQASNCLQTIQ